MLYLFFTISFLLDIIILILLILLGMSLSQLLKSLGLHYNLFEKFKITPDLVTDNPGISFKKYAKRDSNGTYQTSYNQHKKLSRLTKRFIQGALGFLGLKLLILGLIFLNIPRPGASQSQPQYNSAYYLANSYIDFAKGTFNMTQWDDNGLTLQAGQLNGSYISPPIGDGVSINQWKNLFWTMDGNYNKRPDYPKETLAIWTLDSLDNCTAAISKNYKCETSRVDLTRGLYGTNAYNFDGYKSKVKISQNITFSGSFTIGAWIKPDINLYVGSEDQNYVILAKAYGNYLDKKPYELRYDYFFGIKNGSLTLIFWPDANKDHWVLAKNTKFNFIKGQWYHVAGVFDDKAKTIKLYIDGFEQTTTAYDYDGGKINYSPNTKDNFPTWIGSAGYLWTDNEEKMVNIFKGTIDEVFLTNNVMGILDIRSLVNQAGEITLAVRTSDVLPTGGQFLGPNGQLAVYFTNPTANDLSFLTNSKYLQYIIFISRPNTNFKPKVKSVSIDYLSTAQVQDKTQVKTALQNYETISNQSSKPKDLIKEKQATNLFIKFFNKKPATDSDKQIVSVIAYNQDPAKRDLAKEQQAIEVFVKKMRRLPKSDLDWGVIKALAYGQEE